MDVSAFAALQVQALVLNDVRAPLDQARANPIPASAPAADHANVVLELSAAAKNLLNR
jgi:hypothetical protein